MCECKVNNYSYYSIKSSRLIETRTQVIELDDNWISLDQPSANLPITGELSSGQSQASYQLANHSSHLLANHRRLIYRPITGE